MSDSTTPGMGSLADQTSTRCRVGDLLIDRGRQQVTRDGQVIALPKLSYDLLLALVRASPNLASLDGLMEQVWPKAVVSPETLSQRVKLLRDALGDDPRAPRYIEGLRGRGYRLIPEVETAGTTHTAGAAHTVGTAQAAGVTAETHQFAIARGARGWSRMRWVGVGALVVFCGLAAMLLLRHFAPTQPASTRTSVTVVGIQPHSVAVLPFENLSAAITDDYIALGIADSVLHELASSPELIVISRSSSFAMAKPAFEPREIGRRLGVRYLVSGSVQRAGNMLRVTARLIDTASNVELWSLKLDRTIDDVFALQDQIAQRVAQQLDATVQSRSVEYARYGTDAYLAYLKGRALIESRKVKDVEASIEQFSRAVELAPTFGAAIAELARAKLQLTSLGNDSTAETAALMPEFDALIERAIKVDPNAGAAYFLRARRNLERGDPQGGEADFRKGLELAPNFGAGLRDYANYLADKGRDDEALEQLDRARLVEPLSAENHYFKGELLRRGSSHLEEAAALYLQALSVQPEFYPAYARLAQVRWLQGHVAEAIKYGEKSVAIEPSQSWTRERLIWFYVELDDLPAARDILRSYPSGTAEMEIPEALVCYRGANLERAEVILNDSLRDEGVSDGFGVYIATDALIERSIARGDPASARRFIMAIAGANTTHGALQMVEDNFPIIVQLAVLEHAVGNQPVGDDLAQRILAYLDPSRDDVFVGGWAEWSRAAASAILGHDDAALAHLENLIRSNFRNGSWARIEREPAFAALHASPRFQAIVSSVQLWRQGEVRELALMRSRGEVPQRTSEQLSPRGC